MHQGASSPFHGDFIPVLLIGLLSDQPWASLMQSNPEEPACCLFPGSTPVQNPPTLAAPMWGGKKEQKVHGQEVAFGKNKNHLKRKKKRKRVASYSTSLQVLCLFQ